MLVCALVVAATLGVGMLVLQRWVAETRWAAILLVGAWFAVVAIGVAVYAWRHPRTRLATLGTYAAMLVGTLAIGYLIGFRDMVVDEDVAMAATRATAEQRLRALAGGVAGEHQAPKPVELARGRFAGADGHSAIGAATVIEQRDGRRLLTFTEFDVDPGVDVEVFLSAAGDDVSDRIELGGLKGNVGDQQYEIPADADLHRYSNVILWCVPFTVRIAVAELG